MTTLPFRLDEKVRAQWEHELVVHTSAQSVLEAAGALLLAEEEHACATHYESIVKAAASYSPDALLLEYEQRVQALLASLQQDDGEKGALGAQALLARHRIFLIEQGLALAAPNRELFSSEQDQRLQDLDAALRGDLYQLLPLRDERSHALEQVHPENRGSLWWYCLGLELPSDASEKLELAAEVLSTFPGAIPALDQKVEALRQKDLLSSAHRRPSTTAHISLGDTAEAFDAAEAFGAAAAFDAAEARTAGGVVVPYPVPETKERRERLWPLFAGAAIAVLGMGVSGIFYQVSQNAAEREKAALMQQLIAAQEEANQDVKALQNKLANAENLSAAQRAALEAQLQAAEKAAEDARSGGTAASGSQRVRKMSGASAKPSSCPPGDPMCGGL